eukprot:1376083-Rhodomonas_salina.1
MDFLGPFPEANTPGKENYLMVVSDHLSKETIFIPCSSSPHDGEPLNAEKVARLYYDHVVCRHG